MQGELQARARVGAREVGAAPRREAAQLPQGAVLATSALATAQDAEAAPTLAAFSNPRDHHRLSRDRCATPGVLFLWVMPAVSSSRYSTRYIGACPYTLDANMSLAQKGFPNQYFRHRRSRVSAAAFGVLFMVMLSLHNTGKRHRRYRRSLASF